MKTRIVVFGFGCVSLALLVVSFFIRQRYMEVYHGQARAGLQNSGVFGKISERVSSSRSKRYFTNLVILSLVMTLIGFLSSFVFWQQVTDWFKIDDPSTFSFAELDIESVLIGCAIGSAVYFLIASLILGRSRKIQLYYKQASWGVAILIFLASVGVAAWQAS